MESVNRMAIELADEAIDFADELHIGVRDMDNGATVLDFGLEHRGGIEAGLLLAEIQTAGLATLSSRVDSVAGTPRTVVDVSTDHPGLALLGSAKAGWEISLPGFEALGSGPARALVAEETVFEQLGYTDAFDLTVLTLESNTAPTETVAERIAERAGVATDGLYLPTYRTASTVGGVSAAARAAELAVVRLVERGYDPHALLSAAGTAPVAPVADTEATAIGRTTDAIAYGGQVHLTVEDDLEAPEEIASSAADEYGDPLDTVLTDVDDQVASLPASVFAPAAVTIDVTGGPTYTVGETHDEILARSFGL